MRLTSRGAAGSDIPGAPRLLVGVDSHVFDRTKPDEDRLVERLRALALGGSLDLFWPSGVLDEMWHPHAPEATRALARAAPPRRPHPLSARQHIDRIRVRAILRGDGRAGKHDADASHLSESAEAGCNRFITRDGKMLRKRDTLGMALPAGLRIMTLAEFFSDFDGGDAEACDAAV